MRTLVTLAMGYVLAPKELMTEFRKVHQFGHGITRKHTEVKAKLAAKTQRRKGAKKTNNN